MRQIWRTKIEVRNESEKEIGVWDGREWYWSMGSGGVRKRGRHSFDAKNETEAENDSEKLIQGREGKERRREKVIPR
jgi:hypothetical protein